MSHYYRRPWYNRRMRRALSLALASSLLLLSCAGEQGPRAPAFVPHIFLFIGDGMGYSSELLASRYLYGSDDGLAWRSFPFLAWAATWDVDTYDAHATTAGKAAYDEASFDPSLGYDAVSQGMEPWPLSSSSSIAYLTGAATDSASSATAMATGRKTRAGRIAWSMGSASSTGEALQTLPELLRKSIGSMVGIATTVPFDHATPAAFIAHSALRSGYSDIARQMTVSSRPDLLIGGGHPSWNLSYYSASVLDALRGSREWYIAERPKRSRWSGDPGLGGSPGPRPGSLRPLRRRRRRDGGAASDRGLSTREAIPPFPGRSRTRASRPSPSRRRGGWPAPPEASS